MVDRAWASKTNLTVKITKFSQEMHLSLFKIPIDFGLDKPSASISFLIVKAIFRPYLRCFCITFRETVLVNISSNRPSLLTELTFCRKSSMNISIDNRYCNRFIHLVRLIFPANHNSASLCLESRPHLWSRMCVSVLHSLGTPTNLRHESDHRQLDALTVPSTHYVPNDCVYFQPYLLAGTNSIVIDLMTSIR